MELAVSVPHNAWLTCLLAGVLWLCASYVFVTFVYNLTFHPLAQYPGPFWARVCPFSSLFYLYCRNEHLNIYKCHAKYGRSGTILDNIKNPRNDSRINIGPVVRYSPNRLVYNTPEALRGDVFMIL